MYTRRTHDYTPTLKASKEEQQAISARKEMLKVFATTVIKPEVKRKTWEERMTYRTRRFGGPVFTVKE